MSNTSTPKMYEPVDYTGAIFLTLLNGVTLVVGTCGSFLVLTAICFFKRLHTTSNALIANLSISDFGALVVGFVTIILGLFYGEVLAENDWVCSMLIHVAFLFVFTSLGTLQCIAVDRYLIITKPRQIYRQYFSRLGTGVVLLGTWLIAAFLVVISFTICGEATYVNEINACYINNMDTKSWWCLTAVLLVACFTCMISIPLFFVLTFCKIRKTRRKVEASAVNKHNIKNQVLSKEEVAVTRMMLVVYITFLVCWLPMLIVHLVHYNKFPSYILHYSTCILALFNSALNPVVYAGMNRLLRRSFVKIVKCRPRTNRTDTSFSLNHTVTPN